MAEYTFGANIIENLTTGMYQDSKVIYREYIQNACDQIDKAEELGVLRQRSDKGKYPDLGEGIVDVWLYPDKRMITIEDNATGIKSVDFQRILSNIADSEKVMGRDKGFRGIGRLCGLAYCKRLVFTSRWNGEDTVSILTCDALKMRGMLNETNTKVEKHSASDVLDAINDFSMRPAGKDDPAHFFRVELIDISEEKEELFGGRDDDNHADNGFLLGWMWFGKTSFKAAIKEEEISRGLRLRKENIQIGEDDTLRGMFTREAETVPDFV